MTQVLERRIIQRKARDIQKLVELINEYNVIAIVNLYKVRAMQLQELGKRFRSDILLKAAKNILIKRALEMSNKKNITALTKHMVGSTLLLFTHLNPFKVSLLLDKNKIKMRAKAGDIAPNDIVIPAGNTGLPPGPAISELHAVGIRTRIEAGSVWVNRETIVVKKGEAIQLNVASLLSKLGIKPLEVGLKITAAYDNGLVVTADHLTINLKEIEGQLEEAYTQAYRLSLNAVYPTPETIDPLLQIAHSKARNLAIYTSCLTREVATEILTRAYHQMANLSRRVATINRRAAPNEFRQ